MNNFNFKLLAWWEYLVPITGTLILVWLVTLVDSCFSTQGTQYINSQVTHAVYEESYETYVNKTCSRQVPTGTSCSTSNGRTSCHTTYRTEYYDCSYCDFTPEKYYTVDNFKNDYTISRARYYDLKKAWKSKKHFKDLGRNINYHGYCGDDGDAYIIKWNNKPFTSINKVRSEWYENKMLSNRSLANFIDIKDEDVKNYRLYNYPEINNNEQENVLGLYKYKKINKKTKYCFTKQIDYLNGKYGPKYKVKIFVLFFKNQSQLSANMQQAYWKGGNQNELVICIGMNDKGNIKWTKTFSHTYNTRILSDIRYDFQSYKKLDIKMTDIIEKNIPKYRNRNFKEDFKFVKDDHMSVAALIILTILVFVANFFMVNWVIGNEFEANINKKIK
jgi:hypothetical protein